MKWIIYGMILLGSLLMVYNIYGFVRYARNIRRSEKWGEEMRILNVPIFLLVMFLFGYIAVGLFGKPDLIMAGILFGGSIDVNDFIGNFTILNDTIWSFDKAIFVDTSVSSKVEHETDVTTFWGFNGTNTAVVSWVRITYFKTSAFTSKATRTHRA